MSPGPTRSIALLAAFALGALGFAVGWLARGTPPAPASLTAPDPVHRIESVTHEEFDAFRREVLAQLERIGRARAADPSTPATAADEAVIELGRKLDGLDARVAVLSTGVRPGIGGRAWANARGPGSESIEKMIARVQEQARHDHAGERGEEAIPTILREHSLWTVEDVVRTYGPPLHVDGNDGLAFHYGRFALETYSGEYSLCFRFREGFVTDFNFDTTGDW